MAIRVLIVDDSAVMRSVLSELINQAPDIEVVGTATDPIVAREMIKQLNPDVVTLDIEMPRMDGLEFLDKLMRLRPTPVVMISTLTERGSDVTFRALELGAVSPSRSSIRRRVSALTRTRYATRFALRIRRAYAHRPSTRSRRQRLQRQQPPRAPRGVQRPRRWMAIPCVTAWY